jgi:hypothetical protein
VTTDEAMFPVPKKYVRPRPDSSNTIRWTRHTGKRETCGLCILDIRDGLLQMPLATATQRAALGAALWYLCKSHATEVKMGSRKLPR